MSVLLTAAKNSVRPKSRAKSAKPGTKKKTKATRSPSPTPCGYVSKDSVKVWEFENSDRQRVQIMFRNDSKQIWVDREEIPRENIMTDFSSTCDGTVTNFCLGCDKAQIRATKGENGVSHTLTINGIEPRLL